MNQIVLTDEQVRAVAVALKPVPVVDSRGNILGTFSPIWTEEDIAEAKRILASGGPWHTTEQVLAHLRSLEQ